MNISRFIRIGFDARKGREGAREFDQAGRQIQGTATRARRSIRDLKKGFGGLTTAIGGTKRMLIGFGLGFGVFAGIRSMIRTLADFEDRMLAIRAVTSATDAQFAAMEKTARRLGATTRFSATEVASSMEQLVRTGFTVEQALKGVETTLHLASAGFVELGQAGEWSSDIMKQFAMTENDLVRITDVLVAASNSANTTVGRMAEALSYAGVNAAKVGLTIEEAAAAIALLGDNGIGASRAGTALSGVLISLASPTNQAKEALRAMGTSAEELKGIIDERGLIGAFKRLSETQLGVSGSLDSLSAASQVFRRQNAAASLILAGQADQFDRFRDQFSDVEGTGRRAARMIGSSLSNAFKSLGSAIQEAYLALGRGEGGFSDTLKDALNVTADAVRILAGFDMKSREVSETARTLAATMKIVGIAFAGALTLKTLAFITGRPSSSTREWSTAGRL